MSSPQFNKEGCKLKLFTPGPVHVPERILKEMAKPNDTHRSKEYEAMHQLAKDGIQKLLFTKNECLLFPSSATGVMEGCVRNLINDNEKALFLSIGAFGDRWYEIGVQNGKNSVKGAVEMGKAATPEIVKNFLSKDKYSVVCLQSCETSTGVYNPVEKIIPMIKDHGALVCVDSTSSMAGIKIEVDKLKIDVCLASAQKCFALPPGLSVASISSAALEKAKIVKNRGFYFDFISLSEKNKVNQVPNTPPIPQLRALVAQLDYIFNKEGLENRFQRHEQLGKRTRMWARDMGLEMFSEKGYESNTVSTIKNTFNIEIKKMTSMLQQKGYKIVSGYGKLEDTTFRIGHMGEITLKELEDMLKVLSDIIAEIRLGKGK
ncbi:MAG TPA: alanine--glyoxylate aminotransferase family protein [Candidatus Lokiarchaeia archaeon]